MSDEKEEKKFEKPDYCQCCKCSNLVKYDPVPPGMMQEFFRCLLGGRPFGKVYELMGGKIIVSIEDLTGSHLGVFDLQTRYAQKNDQVCPWTCSQLNMISYIDKVSIRDEAGAIKDLYVRPSGDALTDALNDPQGSYDKLLAAVGTALNLTLSMTVNDFTNKLVMLSVGMRDENFWKGAGQF